MVNSSIWVLDHNNNFPPIWEVGTLSLKQIFMVSLLFVIYWIFVYYKGYLTYNFSVIIGLISSLIFLFLYYYQFYANFSVIGVANKKGWYYYKTPSFDMTTDLKLLNKKELKQNINILKDGVVISNDYYKKLERKGYKFSPITNFNMGNENSNNKSSGFLQKYLDKLINFKYDNIIFQGYCLITILFTILTLTRRINKSIFKRVFGLFLQAAVFSIAINYISYWFFSIDESLFVSNLKDTFLFLSISIIIAILSEILYIYI